MVAKTDTMPIQENHSSEKKKAQLKSMKCDSWLIRTASQIEEWMNEWMNEWALRTPDQSPANPHGSSFMVEVKDPMFCLQINREVILESRQVWTEWREKLNRMAQWIFNEF